MAGRKLVSGDFPNTTTLFGWNLAGTGSFDGTAFVGAKTLTENGTMGKNDDPYDEATFNDFGGSDFLTSADAAFAFSGSVSMGCWAYKSVYTGSPTDTFIDRISADGTQGWTFGLSGGLFFIVFKDGAGVAEETFNVSGLSAGWHHFAATLNFDVDVVLYIDGVEVASNADTDTAYAVSGDTDLTLGAKQEGASDELTGRLVDAFVHVDTVLTQPQIETIFKVGAPDAPTDLRTEAFPNSTTLYAWNINNPTTGIDHEFVGNIPVALTGALGTAANHLGNTAACDFDGTNDFFSSSDAAFAFTGSFSIGGWFHRSSWAAPGGSQASWITRNLAAGGGWHLAQDGSSGELAFVTQDGVTTGLVLFDITGLVAGWHHFAATLNFNVELKLYVDGVLENTVADTSTPYGTAGILEIGAFRGGADKFTGRIADVFVHDGTVLSGPEILIIKEFGVVAAAVGNPGSLLMFEF